MSVKDDGKETNEQQPKVEPPALPPSARSSSIPVLLSSLALLLAVFALAATLISSKNMHARQPLDNIKTQLSAMESRVNHVEALIATDKHSLVQAELQKMLLNLRELSRLADNETKDEISKAETILLRLSTPATSVKAKVDLKSTEQPELSTMAAPEAAETSLQQDDQATSEPEQAPAEPKPETESTSVKAVEKPLEETVNTPSPDTATEVTPTTPPLMEK